MYDSSHDREYPKNIKINYEAQFLINSMLKDDNEKNPKNNPS